MKKYFLILFICSLFLAACTEDKVNEDNSTLTELENFELEPDNNDNLMQQPTLVQIGEYENEVYASYDDAALREAFEDAFEELGSYFHFDNHQFVYDDVNDVLTFNVGSDDGSVTGAFDVIVDENQRMYLSSTFTFGITCSTSDCSSSQTGCQVQKDQPDDGTRWCSPCPSGGKCSRTTGELRIAGHLAPSFFPS